MNAERRIFKRVPVELNARCMQCKNGEPAMTIPQHFLCRTKDLSLRGARLLVSENINVDPHLSITLELPNSFKPLLINGDVAWVRESDESNHNSSEGVQFGVKFSRIGSYEEKGLKKYLGLKVNKKFSLAEMIANYYAQTGYVGISTWIPPVSLFMNTYPNIKKNIDKEEVVI